MLGLTWPEFHGAVTHFPVAFLIGVFLFDIGAILFKKPEWRVVSFWLLVGAVIAAAPALLSGWQTGKMLYSGAASPPAIFVTHRTFAFVTSVLAIVLLVWRVAARDKLAGAGLAASVVLAALVMSTVSFTGYVGGKMVFGGSGDSANETSATLPTPMQPTRQNQVDPALIISGQNLYASNGCSGCHLLDGQGGKTGPDLTHEAQRHDEISWQVAHLENPNKIHPGSTMPAYPSLSASKLKALGAFLASRR